jgi:hypothetical protein
VPEPLPIEEPQPEQSPEPAIALVHEQETPQAPVPEQPAPDERAAADEVSSPEVTDEPAIIDIPQSDAAPRPWHRNPTVLAAVAVVVVAAIAGGLWLSGLFSPSAKPIKTAPAASSSGVMTLAPGTQIKEQQPAAKPASAVAASAPVSHPVASAPVAAAVKHEASHPSASQSVSLASKAGKSEHSSSKKTEDSGKQSKHHQHKAATATHGAESQHEEILRKKEQLKQELGL